MNGFLQKLKILSFVIIFVIGIFVTNHIYANSQVVYGLDSAEDCTNVKLDRSPGMILQGKLLILGDSYAYMFCKNCGYDINYIVHRGYDLRKILDELIPLIPEGEFRYCFLFVGPNDMMLQTTTPNFEYYLQEIINALILKNIIPVLTSYPDLDYEKFPEYKERIMGKMYDKVIAIMAKANYIPFIDIKSYYDEYGFEDLVHPAKEMYKPLADDIISYLQSKFNE